MYSWQREGPRQPPLASDDRPLEAAIGDSVFTRREPRLYVEISAQCNLTAYEQQLEYHDADFLR